MRILWISMTAWTALSAAMEVKVLPESFTLFSYRTVLLLQITIVTLGKCPAQIPPSNLAILSLQYLSLFCCITEQLSQKASQLKESMDLYEEIVTEEQQSRETSYSEVICRVLDASFSLSTCYSVMILPYRRGSLRQPHLLLCFKLYIFNCVAVSELFYLLVVCEDKKQQQWFSFMCANYLTILFFLFVCSWSPDSRQLKIKSLSYAGEWSRCSCRFALFSLSFSRL